MIELLFADIRDQVTGLNPADLMAVVKNVITVVTTIAGVIAACVIIYGGVLFITGMGDPGKVSKGKNCIIGGVIGLLVSIIAFAIVNFVLGALN